MSVARIISQPGERSQDLAAQELANDLRARGFSVQNLLPGEMQAEGADLEVTVRRCTAEEALREAQSSAGHADLCVFVTPRSFSGRVRTIQMFVLQPDSTADQGGPATLLEFPAPPEEAAADVPMRGEIGNEAGPLAIVLADSEGQPEQESILSPAETHEETPRTLVDIVDAVVSKGAVFTSELADGARRDGATATEVTSQVALSHIVADEFPQAEPVPAFKEEFLIPDIPAAGKPSAMEFFRPVPEKLSIPAGRRQTTSFFAGLRRQSKFFAALTIFAGLAVLAVFALILVHRSPVPQDAASPSRQPVPFQGARPLDITPAPTPTTPPAGESKPTPIKAPANPGSAKQPLTAADQITPPAAKPARRARVAESDYVAKDTVVHVGNAQSKAQE